MSEKLNVKDKTKGTNKGSTEGIGSSAYPEHKNLNAEIYAKEPQAKQNERAVNKALNRKRGMDTT